MGRKEDMSRTGRRIREGGQFNEADIPKFLSTRKASREDRGKEEEWMRNMVFKALNLLSSDLSDPESICEAISQRYKSLISPAKKGLSMGCVYDSKLHLFTFNFFSQGGEIVVSFQMHLQKALRIIRKEES